MPVTRREFIAGLGGIAGIRLLAPIAVRAGDGFGQVLAEDPTPINRLVVVFQQGGNDGLNTVIPYDGQRRDVYEATRPSIAYTRDEVAAYALDRPGDTAWQLALNPKLRTLHSLYRSDRVAIVQGVDYPGHSFSHFVSTDIWESGQPGEAPDSGWLGRHLDRDPPQGGELKGLGIGTELPLILRGSVDAGVEVSSIQTTVFADGSGPVGDPRHSALARFAEHDALEPLRRFAGLKARETVDVVTRLEGVTPPPRTANQLANSLLTARALLEGDFGVECVFVAQPGYDTHVTQVPAHESLLTSLDQAIEAFLFGTIGGSAITGVGPYPAALAARTVILTISEFGRRIGENGAGQTAGTDHGSAAPLFIVGPPAGSGEAGATLVPGLHREHPDMGSVLAPAENLAKTTDLREVYQSVLEAWLADPDPTYEGAYEPIAGLFTA